MGKQWRPPAWPARLNEQRAAAYLSVSSSTFRARVKAGIYPQPIKEVGLVYWSRVQLDNFIASQFGHPHLLAMEDNSWADLR